MGNTIKCDNCGAVQKNKANLCCEYCLAVLKETPATIRWKEMQEVKVEDVIKARDVSVTGGRFRATGMPAFNPKKNVWGFK